LLGVQFHSISVESLEPALGAPLQPATPGSVDLAKCNWFAPDPVFNADVIFF
jgi:hypothetical protein